MIVTISRLRGDHIHFPARQLDQGPSGGGKHTQYEDSKRTNGMWFHPMGMGNVKGDAAPSKLKGLRDENEHKWLIVQFFFSAF